MASSHRSNAGEGSNTERAKRQLTESACTACQKRKCKCDGQRPTCSKCRSSNTTCQWDVEIGESRVQSLKRQINQLKTEIACKDAESERQGSAVRELVDTMRQYPETAKAIRYVSISDNANAVEVMSKVREHMESGTAQVRYQQSQAGSYQKTAMSTPPVSPLYPTSAQPASRTISGLPSLTSLVSSQPSYTTSQPGGHANQQFVYRMSTANYTVGSDYLQRGNISTGKKRQS